MIRGVIYDLDGTLVDSGLDFDAMRREMNLAPGEPILETLEHLAERQPEVAERCREILHRHELEGARRSAPLPGVVTTLLAVQRRDMPQAIVTRNSRSVAAAAIRCLPDVFDRTLSRDDGPVKPDPWAIHEICEQWQLRASQVVIVGDYRFDIEAGRAAGASTVLLHHGRDAESLGGPLADLLLSSLEQSEDFLRWLSG